ncbi:hypothetical protein K504DRAFT_539455 [Pleomassaria siparia CBS 279.74]|uniref:Transcription factor domain-containing protein n=1 Tax=Pleomassaria siparia CBS 279.74 TaxID=1314801 RepID=A0A6G1JRB5_9PLEO|nr:hypothetical protein K504DRAFT_539455 [Pleomassaria siparia CBS 279.74]
MSLRRNLDECDVQPPQPSDYSDYSACGPNAQVEYAIALTYLCIILRDIYCTFFGPHSARSNRSHTLAETDDALARWSLYAAPFAPPPSDSSAWTVAVDVTSARPPVPFIQAIFESLAGSESLPSLWVFSVTVLFTAMIQLGAEFRFSNPLLAVAAMRRYDSTLYSLRQLSRHVALSARTKVPARSVLVPQIRYFDTKLENNSLTGPPRTELEKAWHALLQNDNIRIPRPALDSLNLKSIYYRDGSHGIGTTVAGYTTAPSAYDICVSA